MLRVAGAPEAPVSCLLFMGELTLLHLVWTLQMSCMTKSCRQLSEKTCFLVIECQVLVPSEISAGREKPLLHQDPEGHGEAPSTTDEVITVTWPG